MLMRTTQWKRNAESDIQFERELPVGVFVWADRVPQQVLGVAQVWQSQSRRLEKIECAFHAPTRVHGGLGRHHGQGQK